LGFVKLQISQEALAAGEFRISEASGIFPDGLLFDFPASEPAPPSIPLAGCFAPDQNSLGVYLTVPNYRQSGLNVSIPNQRADTRYLAEVVTVRDENSGLAEKPVQVARKNYRLLTEGDSRQECSSLPVARVREPGPGSRPGPPFCAAAARLRGQRLPRRHRPAPG